MQYKFASGAVITGTPEEMAQAIAVVEPNIDRKGLYNSSTKGLVRIVDMNDYHLKNAILRKWKDFLREMNGRDISPFQVLAQMQAGPYDGEYFMLVHELASRTVSHAEDSI